MLLAKDFKFGFFLTFVGLGFLGVQSVTAQQNSTKKDRVRPSTFASEAGQAIKWRNSVDEALAEAKKEGKPVFWYIPSVEGTFMDRKPVIDRYMLAGPFSWPAIIDLLNNRFVPLNSLASGQHQTTYDLQPYRFVEPGFVLLDAHGEKLLAVDQITTLDPDWFVSLICDALKLSLEPVQRTEELVQAWSNFKSGNYDFDVEKTLPYEDLQSELAQNEIAERILLRGFFLFRRGKHAAAAETWRMSQARHPEHPLARKAQAEAEGWGPFVRGFEVHRNLPDQALRAGLDSRGSTAPKSVYTEQDLWDRSVEFLLDMQREDGAWVDSDYDFGGTDSLPNVHVAVTALCGIALIEAVSYLPSKHERLQRAIEKAAAFVSNTANINYADRDEILWAHAYRSRFLARLIEVTGVDLNDGYRSALMRAVDDLQKIQEASGVWYHEYTNPFVTATALTALYRVEAVGVQVNPTTILHGVNALSNDRFDNGAFPYSSRGKGHRADRRSGEGQIPASAGRMPLCELALYQRGHSDDEKLRFALHAAFENHKYLNNAYKYDDHTSTMGYGGFFFWYDMHGRSEAISFIKDKDFRRELTEKQRSIIMSLPEYDGCFVDSHELGRCYGTAMALKCLAYLKQADSQ
ncbi:MAG TPA: hypothetical protein PKD64_11330 [Pirellulaceae bacterium]|nr:hypothetical protein [Pirellulaceae bacterium]HMO92774.1 hypothetical protein [Pirellulaceae bacterium]HMP69356.1 hypothetical protein [Pirellulaceae bacterium]